jgi:hypothetical protein
MPPRARARAEALAIARRLHLAGRRQFGVGSSSFSNLGSSGIGRELDEIVLKAGAESIAEAERIRQRIEAEHAARFRAWWAHWIAPDLERVAELAGGELPAEGSVRWCLAHTHWIPAGVETCGPEGNALERERAAAAVGGMIVGALASALLAGLLVLGTHHAGAPTVGEKGRPFLRPANGTASPESSLNLTHQFEASASSGSTTSARPVETTNAPRRHAWHPTRSPSTIGAAHLAPRNRTNRTAAQVPSGTRSEPRHRTIGSGRASSSRGGRRSHAHRRSGFRHPRQCQVLPGSWKCISVAGNRPHLHGWDSTGTARRRAIVIP